MLIVEDQKNYQHAPSTVQRNIKCTMWGTFIFKIHATSPKSSLIYYPPSCSTVRHQAAFRQSFHTGHTRAELSRLNLPLFLALCKAVVRIYFGCICPSAQPNVSATSQKIS